jgi:phospho-N-acetylmuramoyl-pentapeptide-transferase
LINSSIGIIDDLTKLRHKKNAGLTPRAKLVLQFIASVLFLIARAIFIGDETTFSLPFASFGMDALYYPLAMIILVGITNCANLTDGVDGLASSVAFAIGISSFYISYQRYDTVCLMSAALSAAAIGFLVFNVHPAKVFMGDTGSLFLGSLVAAMAFDMGNPLLAVTGGGVYVIEGLSVIAQVTVFKLCKKRLFKMAPIHHHLEKSGWDENKICILAIILTLLFAVATMLLCVR